MPFSGAWGELEDKRMIGLRAGRLSRLRTISSFAANFNGNGARGKYAPRADGNSVFDDETLRPPPPLGHRREKHSSGFGKGSRVTLYTNSALPVNVTPYSGLFTKLRRKKDEWPRNTKQRWARFMPKIRQRVFFPGQYGMQSVQAGGSGILLAPSYTFAPTVYPFGAPRSWP